MDSGLLRNHGRSRTSLGFARIAVFLTEMFCSGSLRTTPLPINPVVPVTSTGWDMCIAVFMIVSCSLREDDAYVTMPAWAKMALLFSSTVFSEKLLMALLVLCGSCTPILSLLPCQRGL